MNMNLTLIGQAISFAIFVWFCLKYVWPPVLKALEERESRIADGLAAAERGKHELELAEQRATDVIRDGKDKAQDFITQAQKRADEIVEAAKTTAREEADRIKAAANAEIEQNRNQARDELRAQVARLAVAGAEQILMREIDETAHREVLDKLAANL
ncbi:MAG: F0F1 ATP synthase subunit B [Gammaproteobacteria bacterium]|uniref:F0F1 ATP synthase subunit B n=1 Tax=Algiphilus sp. TaxID=1872431 RepID=UPI0032F05091